MRPKAMHVEATTTAEPIHQDTLPQEQEGKIAIQPVHLSAEQIGDPASATKEILSAVLAEEEETSYVHHWGINE